MMSKESHQTFLEQSAIREAKKRARKGTLDVDDLSGLRIQTMEPLWRLLLGLFGVLVTATAIWLQMDVENLFLTLVVGAIGLFLISLAVFGRRRSVEDALVNVSDIILRGVDDVF